jgi:hypothetical protein
MMSEHSPVGAWIADWKPETRPDALPDYLEQLESDFFREDVNYTKEAWSAYESHLNRHFKRLKSFLDSDKKSLQNLVLGNVQSGKTGHLLANICWARDNGFHLVILLSGNKITLNDQTYNRLIDNLPRNAALVEKGLTKKGIDFESSISELQSKIKQRVRDASSPIPVVVLIKRHERLDALTETIEKLQLRYEDSIKVMILDDEADQASPDNTASKRGSNAKKGAKKPASKSKSAHESIRKLRDVIRGRNIYLSYTATPQALMHGELDGMLQPQFCSTVPAGPSYVGIKDLVDQESAVVDVGGDLDCMVSSSTLTQGDQDAEVLEKVFADFLISAWLHDKHVEVFHGLAQGSVYECNQSSVQLLIHPSGKQSDHAKYFDLISDLLKIWKSDMSSDLNRIKFINEIFQPNYVEVINRASDENKNLLLIDEQMRDCWEYIYALISSPNDLKVLLVNSQGRAKLSNTGDEGAFIPINNSEWQGPKAWILVGGEILGRGLTIPHLVTTLFLRNTKSPNFDTSVQQMRFCGYRKTYLSFIRIYAPSDICNDYADAVEIDEIARNRAIRWDIDNRDLLNSPPVVRFIAPRSSRYKPTRNSAISGFVAKRNPSSTSGFFRLEHICSPTDFEVNAKLLKDFAKTGDSIDTFGKSKILQFEAAQVLDLLKNWRLNSNEGKEFQTFREMLTYSKSEGGLSEEIFKFAIDQSISERDWTQELAAAQIQSRASSEWDYRRTVIPFLSNQAWIENSADFDFGLFRVKTLVGGQERTLKDNFADDYLMHARLYALFASEAAETRNFQGKPFGLGISLIGWTPKNEFEYWAHGQVDQSDK